MITLRNSLLLLLVAPCLGFAAELRVHAYGSAPCWVSVDGFGSSSMSFYVVPGSPRVFRYPSGGSVTLVSQSVGDASASAPVALGVPDSAVAVAVVGPGVSPLLSLAPSSEVFPFAVRLFDFMSTFWLGFGFQAACEVAGMIVRLVRNLRATGTVDLGG